MNNKLRKEVKLLKANQGITFKELSEYLEIKESSFYCWLNNRYDLGYEKQQRLKEILNDLSETE